MTAGAASPAAGGYDVVVVGCGIAGLSAALSAKEADPLARVLVLERAPAGERGGSSRYTAATLRLDDELRLSPSFLDEMDHYSAGRADRGYFAALARELPETLGWMSGLGVELRHANTIFVTQAAERQIPLGLGKGIVDTLAAEAERLGVEIAYETTALSLVPAAGGGVGSIGVRRSDGSLGEVATAAVVIASGGFEGNEQMLAEHVGAGASRLRQLSPGGRYNTGQGIAMALELGAAPSGEWDAFHGEPVDPRSSEPEAVVMVFPYGILVNSRGERFVDEGWGLADDMCEDIARRISAEPDGLAWFVGDQRLYSVPGYEHALLTEQPPITAGSVAELAEAISVDRGRLEQTIAAFNAAVVDGAYEPTALDGKHTEGTVPPKSNWAQPLDAYPLVAYPMVCAIVFTFGGIATSTAGEVLDAGGAPIPGLFAAGECTGVYYGVYPGSTSVMRSLVFGRIAGRSAAGSGIAAAAPAAAPARTPAAASSRRDGHDGDDQG